jgi:predicted enzyme related to lactoylglutathione lyase
MGLNPEYGDESGVYADFQAGSAKLALYKRELMAEAIGATSKELSGETQDVVAVILGVSNVDETFDALSKRGANFVDTPQDRPGWGIRCVHLRDPAGNLIEFYQTLD